MNPYINPMWESYSFSFLQRIECLFLTTEQLVGSGNTSYIYKAWDAPKDLIFPTIPRLHIWGNPYIYPILESFFFVYKNSNAYF